jgi:hypothetical protein
MVRGKGANAEWRCDQEKRGTGVKTEVVEQENDGSKSSGKKGHSKRGCGNVKGYFLEGRATHIHNHECAHMHDGWRVVRWKRKGQEATNDSPSTQPTLEFYKATPN